MTNEELDLARAKEAMRLHPAYTGQTFEGLSPPVQARYLTLARLAREGWVPIDPLLIEAREIVAKEYETQGGSCVACSYRAGTYDDTLSIKIALVALRSREPK